MTLSYSYWREMLKRCYDKVILEKHPSYKNCSVCEEWHCFQTFAKWFDENYYTMGNDKMCLDKDIINKGNKIYSSKTCVFVPQRINTLFVKRQNDRGDLPIGVIYKEKNRKYQTRCNCIDKRKSLGMYDTKEEAFYKGYKPFKELYIKEVANDYKYIILHNLYEAMINYVIEIND